MLEFYEFLRANGVDALIDPTCTKFRCWWVDRASVESPTEKNMFDFA